MTVFTLIRAGVGLGFATQYTESVTHHTSCSSRWVARP
jgi:hypothetical protein